MGVTDTIMLKILHEVWKAIHEPTRSTTRRDIKNIIESNTGVKAAMEEMDAKSHG